MYRIHEVKLKIGQDRNMIPDIVRKKLNQRDLVMKNIRIVRESVDARNKSNIRKVYTVDFDANMDLDLPVAPDLAYEVIRPKSEFKRPVIAGFGPCGIFTALVLAQAGMRPIVIERGKSVGERTKDVERFWNTGILDTESNVQFGEGGAGAFSDGKLTTGIKDPRIRKVLEELSTAGGGEEILYKHRPHIGTDVLRTVVANIRCRITELGGEIRFGCRMTDFVTEKTGSDKKNIENSSARDHRIRSVIINDSEELFTDDLVIAVGHSARDTFEMLAAKGILMEQKPFSIGVRIQHPQSLINRAQYGDPDLAGILGPAEYKLSHHLKNGRGVYTFCMCPGGEVIRASSEEGGVVTNGMSYNARDGRFANSGLLCDVRIEDFGSNDVLAGVWFQRKYEQIAYEISGSYDLPEARWGEFKKSPVMKCLPDFAGEGIIEAMPYLGRRLKGFDDPRSMMFAVETRSSSPVRFPRDEKLMSNIFGIYPGGEGAGHAGGIVSAAVDGIRIAEAIASRYV